MYKSIQISYENDVSAILSFKNTKLYETDSGFPFYIGIPNTYDYTRICNCKLALMRIYPTNIFDNFDKQFFFRGSEARPVLLLFFNNGNEVYRSNKCQNEESSLCYWTGEFILKTTGIKQFIINGNSNLYLDYTISFWFKIKNTNKIQSANIIDFKVKCPYWSISYEFKDKKGDLNLQINRKNVTIIETLKANEWYFMRIIYHDYNIIPISVSAGILNLTIRGQTINSNHQIIVPETLLSTCDQRNIQLGALAPKTVIYFKQFRIYNGSLINNPFFMPQPDCDEWIGSKSFDSSIAVSSIFIESVNFYDCLFSETKLFNDNTKKFTDTCEENVKNGISSSQIRHCEKCNGKCPEGICKDGILEQFEKCDDGIMLFSNSNCEEYCDAFKEGYNCISSLNKSICLPICGDGIIKGDEQCDDNNLINGDGCDMNCKIESDSYCEVNSFGTSVCKKCIDNCKICKEKKCIECLINSYLFEDQCLNNCPTGTIKSKFEEKSICRKCSVENCISCSFDVNSIDFCLVCADTYFLLDNFVCNKTCDVALGYYIYRENKCKKCSEKCLNCVYSEEYEKPICSKCIQNFYLLNYDCVDKIICIENCEKCSNIITCEKCVTNYNLNTNGICILSCPSNNYIDNNKKCSPCPMECSKCSDYNTCTSCNKNYILENNKCNVITEPPNTCNKYCLNCDLEKKCLKCDQNYYLVEDGKCQPICPPTGYYLSKSTQTCNKCISNCIRCIDDLHCLTCARLYDYFNNVCEQRCQLNQLRYKNICTDCKDIPGLNSKCEEICGNGILYNNDGTQCDDGNTKNNDGCDSNCKIEPNYECKRNDIYTPDVCYENSTLSVNLVVDYERLTRTFLVFNKDFILKDKSLLSDSISINITNTRNIKYKYNISLFSLNTIQCIFTYYSSFQNATLIVTLNNLSNYLDSRNKTFTDLTPITLSNLLPKYIYLDEQTINNIESMTSNTEKAGIATVTFSAAPLALIQAMNVFWCLIDAMQTANFYLLINIDYPMNVAQFFNILSSSNLDFIPNYFASIFNIKFNKKTATGVKVEIDPIIKAPYRFDKLNKTSSFIQNGGSFASLLFIVFIIYFLLSLADKIFKKRKSTNKASVIISKIYNLVRYSIILRIQITGFLTLNLATFLQLRVCSAKEKSYLYGFILSSICLSYLFFFFYIVLKIVNNPKVLSKDQEYFQVYGTLYDGLDVTKTIPRNYQPIMLIRKFIFCAILVFSHDYPFVTIILITLIQLTSAIIITVYKPFLSKSQNFVAVFSEIFLTIVMIMIFTIHIINVKENVNNDINNDVVDLTLKIGWVLITFCLLVLILYLFLFVYEQYYNWKKAKEIIGDVTKKTKATIKRLQTMMTKSRTLSMEKEDSAKTENSTVVKKSKFAKEDHI